MTHQAIIENDRRQTRQVKMSPSSLADETVTEIITASPVDEFAPPLLLKDDSLSPPSSPSESHLPPTSHRHRREHNLRLRLIVLISVAFLALTAVAAISQQLFIRHFAVQVLHDKLNTNSSGGIASLLAENVTRVALRGTMLRHVNRTRVLPAALAERYIYDYDDVTYDVETEVAESLIDKDGGWSQLVEQYLDTRPYPAIDAELGALRNNTIVHLEPGIQHHCGDQNDGFILFRDGRPGCVRYREPHQQLILGEIFSYYLARLLGVRNVPAAALSQVCSSVEMERNRVLKFTKPF
jgi:hypothetical protein